MRDRNHHTERVNRVIDYGGGHLDGQLSLAKLSKIGYFSLDHEPHHYTMFYEDVQASLDKATELGGKKIVGPIPTPAGTFAWFSDPDGNMFGLLKPAK